MSNSKNVVLITGALAGIGRATALAFAKEGANIVISGRQPNVGNALAKDLRDLGAEAEFVVADVRSDDDLRRLVNATVTRFGRLDAAVNNAGTEGQLGMVIDQTEESFVSTFNTNVLGTLLAMKYEMKVMQAQKSGSIINVSSAFGKVGAKGASVYVASKHAVEGLTKSAALEGADFGVRVNAVAPGPIETGMLNRFVGNSDEIKAAMASTVPLKRVGEPEEVAQLIVYLASSKSPYITGQSMSIDGGYTAA